MIQVIRDENLQANALDVGNYLLKGFAALREKYAIVGDVRGKGLLIGIELVADKVFSSLDLSFQLYSFQFDVHDLQIINTNRYTSTNITLYL